MKWSLISFGPWEIWSPHKKYCMTFSCKYQISLGQIFSETKFLANQISWGPKKSGVQMRSGTILVKVIMYIKVAQGDILTEQKMWFGRVWFWADWQYVLKKKLGADYEELLRAFNSCFHGQNICLKFFKKHLASALKSGIKSLLQNVLFYFFLNFFWLKIG